MSESGDGELVVATSASRAGSVDCPECRRLVWLATGERELGDGLESP